MAHELLVATRGNVAQAIEMLLDDDHDLVVSLIPRRHVFVDLLYARFHSSRQPGPEINVARDIARDVARSHVYIPS